MRPAATARRGKCAGRRGRRWSAARARSPSSARGDEQAEQQQVEGEGQVERERRGRELGRAEPAHQQHVGRLDACWVRLARISGQASASVARSSARHGCGVRLPVKCRLRPPSVIAGSVARNPVEKVWPLAMAALCASAAANCQRPTMKFVARNLEAAGRDQGRARPPAHAAVLRRALRRPVGAAGAGQGRRARPRPQWQRGRAAVAARMVGRRGRRRDRSNIACAIWSRRSTRRRSDGRVKAVALDLDGFTGGGQTAIGDLAEAVRRVRAAGKPVIAYGTGYTNDSYQLASAASEIWLNPLGARADRRPGRLEPLLQGPARQARRDRERLSRRHLQVGGRAVHPQRHVARGARRITWRSTRPARKLAEERPAGAAQGEGRPVPART